MYIITLDHLFIHVHRYYILLSTEYHTKQNVGQPRHFATWLLLPSRSCLKAPLKGKWFGEQKVESRNEQQ